MLSRDSGRAIPDWPKLLHLYSRMRPGITVFEWMQDHDVHSIGIDVRRFASFGVIKARLSIYLLLAYSISMFFLGGQGFLRRVQRWPILLVDDVQQPQLTEAKPTTLPPSPISGRKRASSLTVPPYAPSSMRPKRRTSDALPAFATISAHSPSGTVSLPPRAAEASLGTLRSRTGAGAPSSSPQTIRARHSIAAPASLFEITQALAAPATVVRPRLSRSPSFPLVKTQSNGGAAAPAPVLVSQPLAYPPALAPLLDGEHHADELCCQFEVGWPTLERWLVAVGGGSGDGDFGKVLIIYR